MRRVLLVLTVLATVPALAQDKLGREQIQRLQRELGRVQQERVQLEQQLAQEKQKSQDAEAKAAAGLTAAKATAARERTSRAAVEAEVEKLKGESAEQDKKLKQAEAVIAALRAKQDALGATLADRERQGQSLEVALAAEKKEREMCEGKNLKLYQYGAELLERYRTKGAWDAIAQQEPFTGIKDVEIFNVVQEYRDKLDSQRVQSKAQESK
jgi:chromosome segregation ATPase